MPDETPPSPTDPLFGNNPSDLMRGAMDPEKAPTASSDSRAWQPPAPEDLQAQLSGYGVDQFIARGGMGAVYRGRHLSLDRAVAIKILPPLLREIDPTFAQRFKQESRAMAQLNHPAIVGVYSSGEMADGTLYFIMEFIDGTDVAQMVIQQGRLSSAHAMAITAHVCDALQYAHTHGVVHRDIKPANIMVGFDGRVKVADFGLAKSSNVNQASLTMSGHVMGTPHFLAPEALMLGGSVDHRADIYAVGVMLYQMLTGKLPKGIFEMPSMLVAGLDPRFDQIIAKAMREERSARYQAILEMRQDLDGMLTQPVKQTLPPSSSATAPENPTAKANSLPEQKQPVVVRAGQKSSLSLWVLAAAAMAIVGFIIWMEVTAPLVDPVKAADQEPQTTTPIDMSLVYNEEMDHLRANPEGTVNFGKPERPFVFSTPAKGFLTENRWGRENAESAHLQMNIAQPRRIYAVLTGSAAGDPSHHGQQVGVIIMSFADGTQFQAEIKAGITLRAETWGYDDEPTLLGPITDGPVTWSNVLAEAQNRGRPAKAFLDMLEIRLPPKKAATTLTGITIKDTSRETLNTFEPGFCIYALSVGHG
jgi:serine/threonine protein kinase